MGRWNGDDIQRHPATFCASLSGMIIPYSMTFHHFGFETIRSPKLVDETIYRKQQEWMGHTMLSRWTFPFNQSCLIEEKRWKHNGFLNDISSTSIIDGKKHGNHHCFWFGVTILLRNISDFAAQAPPLPEKDAMMEEGQGKPNHSKVLYTYIHTCYIYK